MSEAQPPTLNTMRPRREPLHRPALLRGRRRSRALGLGLTRDPYLMTGYDRKRVELRHDGAAPVTMAIRPLKRDMAETPSV